MKIVVARSPDELAQKAADRAQDIIAAAIRERGAANIVLATGMSQVGVLARLAAASGVAWDKVAAFHLDEYVGLDESHPASLRRYLRKRFVDLVPLGAFHGINPDPDPAAECRRLTKLVGRVAVDLCFLGVGENGHLAFNEPPADFEASQAFLVVEPDQVSRRRQAEEGWFARPADVPRRAISMSIPQILRARDLICLAPGRNKAKILQAALEGPVTPNVPASVLQRHEGATVYLDDEAAALLKR